MGYLRRRLAHKAIVPEERESLYGREAPTLAVLVPSYKEELDVVRRTLVSAALQDYPHKQIVLLIDDNPAPNNPWDKSALDAMRALPIELQAIFNEAAAPYLLAQAEFLTRLKNAPFHAASEALVLSRLYESATAWLRSYAESNPPADHADQLMHEKVLESAARLHETRAHELFLLGDRLTLPRARREYRRLAAQFNVRLVSFERKRYANLSREANKAMNLNSYIRLLGRSWNAVQRDGKTYLEETQSAHPSMKVPAADFVITLDADSFLTPEYALVLVHEMLREGNERLAVAQTPYNAIQGANEPIERIAGATTDIQYLIHQGFTHYRATYWVGANALLRTKALADIRTTVQERGFEMPVFIQDRTVIEDTESSIDLVACGWSLYNYPERMAFSATPPDFGALLIQRRRWANGGLIILPKLLGYLLRRPNMAKVKEGFFRAHYLASIAVVNIGLLALFGHSFEANANNIWLPFSALPYFVLYARDLSYSGYRMRDLFGVYVLNLLLVPVNLSGVFKSLHQGIVRHKIPFARTPKISGRTRIPLLYCLAELALPSLCLGAAAWDASQGRWAHAAFGAINGALFVYGLFALIGIKNLLNDLRGGLGLGRAAKKHIALAKAPSEHLMPPQRHRVDVSDKSNVA